VLILVVVVAVVTSQIAPINTLGARRGDMIATLLYFANWHFIAAGQSYFAQFSGVSPLEHMWSLAIEEQFYLLWPLLIIGALAKWRGRARPLLWVMGIGAVVSAARMISSYDVANPSRAYFGTDTRAHALLVGALLATVLCASPRLLASERLRNAAAWAWPLVVALIGLAFVGMKDQTGFYYEGGAFLFALVVAALLLVLEALPRSVPGRLLSLRPVRWIGMISYGLYLWHWPMIIWLRGSSSIGDPHTRELVALLLTFAVATASFYLVERPIRAGRAPWLGNSRKRLAAAVPVGVVAVAVIVAQSTNVGSDPIALQVNDVGAHDCPAGSPAPAPGFVWCTRVAPSTQRSSVIATIGDSTALALDAGMQKLASQRGWGYVQAGKNGCSVLSLLFPNGPTSAVSVAGARPCLKGIPRLLADVAAKRHPDVWLVSDRWSILPLLDRGRVLQPGDAQRRRLLAAAWNARLKALTAHGAKVVIVVTPPQGPPVECATESPPPADCGSGAYTTADPETAAGRAAVESAAARFPGSVAAVSVDDIVCPDNGRCPAVVDGLLTRYDGIHYTATFSSRVLDAIFSRAERAGIPLHPR
jgi:peptidoglycan/LPS O-acetylase OafA/YrhL